MIHGHGDDISLYPQITLNFSSNVYPHPHIGELFHHLETCWHRILSYPEPAAETAERALAESDRLRPEEVCMTNGATEAIYLIAQAFAGSRSYILAPTFAEYADACRMHRHEVRFIYSPDDLPEGASLAWLCNPNNPTGDVVPHADLERLICRHPHTVFIIDQSYEDFTTERLFSPQEAADMPNVILLHSLTKRYGIPGLRAGYLTAREELTSQIRRMRMPWAVNTLAQEATLYLTRHAADFRPDLTALLEERERTARRMEELRLAEVWPGKTPFLLARLRMGKASALKNYLARQHGMLIRDAGNFEGLDHRYFRIAVQSREADDRLLSAIQQLILEE